ncbi:hypothetical protein N9Z65_00960 [bacterium]|nr:hypothetical protein [bacterium]
MRFDIEIKLPSGKVTRVQELNNREYLTIVKYIHNDDFKGLNTYFEKLILDPHLNIFDRLYLLIYYRMVFIDSRITLDVDGTPTGIELASILNKLEERYIDLEVTFVDSDIEVVLDLPASLYFDKIDEFLISTIKTITYNGNHLKFHELSTIECEKILDNLPNSIFTNIKNYTETISNNLKDIVIIEKDDNIGLPQHSIDMIGNGGINFISSIFAIDLNSFYNTVYIFENIITPGSDIFFDLSPIESTIITEHHSQRIKDEEAELKKQEQKQQL